jgi:sugar phosphate permease
MTELTTMRPSMMVDIEELVSAGKTLVDLWLFFCGLYALMSPISGVIADRLNRKWLIVGSLLVWSSVHILMGYATTFNHIMFTCNNGSE